MALCISPHSATWLPWHSEAGTGYAYSTQSGKGKQLPMMPIRASWAMGYLVTNCWHWIPAEQVLCVDLQAAGCFMWDLDIAIRVHWCTRHNLCAIHADG